MSEKPLLPLVAGARGALTRCGLRSCALAEPEPASSSSCSILLHVVYAFRSFVLVSRWRRLGVSVALGVGGRRHKTRQAAASSCLRLVPTTSTFAVSLLANTRGRRWLVLPCALACRLLVPPHTQPPCLDTPNPLPTCCLHLAHVCCKHGERDSKTKGAKQGLGSRFLRERSLPAATLPRPCCFVLLAL